MSRSAPRFATIHDLPLLEKAGVFIRANGEMTTKGVAQEEKAVDGPVLNPKDKSGFCMKGYKRQDNMKGLRALEEKFDKIRLAGERAEAPVRAPRREKRPRAEEPRREPSQRVKKARVVEQEPKKEPPRYSVRRVTKMRVDAGRIMYTAILANGKRKEMSALVLVRNGAGAEVSKFHRSHTCVEMPEEVRALISKK